jgi:hypothetical protein
MAQINGSILCGKNMLKKVCFSQSQFQVFVNVWVWIPIYVSDTIKTQEGRRLE